MLPPLAGLQHRLEPNRFTALETVSEVLDPVPLPDQPVPRIGTRPEDYEVWGLPLREAVQIALGNSEVFRVLSGNDVTAGAATDYDVGIAVFRQQAALAAFDATFNAGYVGDQINEPPGTFFGPGIPSTLRRDDGTFTTSVVKPWVTGGQSRIAFNPSDGYIFLPRGTDDFNPKYATNIELEFRQPLLRGAGVEVNRVPIRIAGIRADQSAWDVKQSALGLVRSVEEAYWQLQAAHAALRALDEVIPLMEGVANLERERFEAERSVKADVAKAKAQLAGYRQQRVQARADAIQKELQLRNLLGMEPADGRTILPTGTPSQAPLHVDPEATIRTALQYRPDIMKQRLSVRMRELELLVAENARKPQLDLIALYRTNGLQERLDDSLEQMYSFEYTDWQLGMNFSMPIGNRAPKANLRAAELQLQRETAVLRQTAHATAYRLSDILRQLESFRGQFEEAQRRATETGIWLEGAKLRYEDPPPAGDGQDWLLLALNDYLLALRARADAVTDAAVVLAQYNIWLARLEEAKGTLLAMYGIELMDDPAFKFCHKHLWQTRLPPELSPDVSQQPVEEHRGE